MNLIFFGTSEFAVPTLEALTAAGFMPAAVVTLPDRSQGRGLRARPSPIKISAEKRGIPVLQPETVSDPEFLKKFSETEWDVGVVAAYGKLIPQKIIAFPRKGLLNIHPSLLPELRGPSPIQYAILEGRKTTGVTIMLLDAEMDHGPILAQEKLTIEPYDTAETLGARLSERGAELLIAVLPQWLAGSLSAQEQDHTRVTFSKKIRKEDGHIRWDESADRIGRKIRAFQPWPGTFGFLNLKEKRLRVKIVGAIPENASPVKTPGLVERRGHDMIVWCGDGFLRIQKIHPEGRRIMAGTEFLKGYPDVIGTVFHPPTQEAAAVKAVEECRQVSSEALAKEGPLRRVLPKITKGPRL